MTFSYKYRSWKKKTLLSLLKWILEESRDEQGESDLLYGFEFRNMKMWQTKFTDCGLSWATFTRTSFHGAEFIEPPHTWWCPYCSTSTEEKKRSSSRGETS